MKQKFAILSVFAVGVLAMTGGLSSQVRAAASSIVISEVMTGRVDSQSSEFVELYNNSDQAMVLDGWTIEYKASTGKTWSKRASLASTQSLGVHDFLVLSTELEAPLHLTSGMAQTGGNLRLRDKSGVVVDQFAWGDGDSPEGEALTAPALGQSMERVFADGSNVLGDTDNNSADFRLSSAPSEALPPQTVVETDQPPVITPVATGSYAVVISELLPDPQSPLSDTRDEFIELYNDGDAQVNLEGWSLRDKTNHVYKISGVEIPAYGYSVFKSGVTKISLNNDGDEISLVDPAGTVVDTSPNYGAAKPGLSWGLSDGSWAWLGEPTPGGSNASAMVPASKTTSEPKSKTSSTKQPAAKSAKKAKASSRIGKAAKASAAPGTYTQPDLVRNSKIWSWLLIALGAGTIGYGIYAYRPEITHFIHQLRSKLGNR